MNIVMHKIININIQKLIMDPKFIPSLSRIKTIFDKRQPNIGIYAEAPIDEINPTIANHLGE